jgi:MFS family permease
VTPPLPSEPSSADALSFWKNPFLWLREKSLSRSFWIFFAVAFFYDAGLSIYVFLFNLYLLDFHFNERAIGLIGGSMMLGSLIGTLPAGVLARRIGLRPLLMFTLTAAPLIFVLRTLWVWEPAQLVIAFLAGISLSTWGVCFLPAVAKVTTERNRPAAFGLLFSAGIGTGALGGILCGYLPQWLSAAGFIMQPAAVKRLILLAACGMVLLGIVPLLSLRFPTPVQTEPLAEAKPEAGNWLRGLRVHPFLLRYLPLMALWAAILNSFPPFANVYLSRQLHTPLAHIGVIFSSAQVLQFFMGLVAPGVLRWLGLVNGIVAMLAFMGVALGAMDAAGHGGLTIAFYLAFAGTQWMSTSGLYSLLIDEVPDKDLSTASAMTMFCSTLAGSAATAGAGILFTRFGYPAVVAGIATLALVTAVLFRLLLGQAKGRTVRHPELTNELLGRTD